MAVYLRRIQKLNKLTKKSEKQNINSSTIQQKRTIMDDKNNYETTHSANRLRVSEPKLPKSVSKVRKRSCEDPHQIPQKITRSHTKASHGTNHTQANHISNKQGTQSTQNPQKIQTLNNTRARRVKSRNQRKDPRVLEPQSKYQLESFSHYSRKKSNIENLNFNETQLLSKTNGQIAKIKHGFEKSRKNLAKQLQKRRERKRGLGGKGSSEVNKTFNKRSSGGSGGSKNNVFRGKSYDRVKSRYQEKMRVKELSSISNQTHTLIGQSLNDYPYAGASKGGKQLLGSYGVEGDTRILNPSKIYPPEEIMMQQIKMQESLNLKTKILQNKNSMHRLGLQGSGEKVGEGNHDENHASASSKPVRGEDGGNNSLNNHIEYNSRLVCFDQNGAEFGTMGTMTSAAEPSAADRACEISDNGKFYEVSRYAAFQTRQLGGSNLGDDTSVESDWVSYKKKSAQKLAQKDQNFGYGKHSKKSKSKGNGGYTDNGSTKYEPSCVSGHQTHTQYPFNAPQEVQRKSLKSCKKSSQKSLNYHQQRISEYQKHHKQTAQALTLEPNSAVYSKISTIEAESKKADSPHFSSCMLNRAIEKYSKVVSTREDSSKSSKISYKQGEEKIPKMFTLAEIKQTKHFRELRHSIANCTASSGQFNELVVLAKPIPKDAHNENCLEEIRDSLLSSTFFGLVTWLIYAKKDSVLDEFFKNVEIVIKKNLAKALPSNTAKSFLMRLENLTKSIQICKSDAMKYLYQIVAQDPKFVDNCVLVVKELLAHGLELNGGLSSMDSRTMQIRNSIGMDLFQRRNLPQEMTPWLVNNSRLLIGYMSRLFGICQTQCLAYSKGSATVEKFSEGGELPEEWVSSWVYIDDDSITLALLTAAECQPVQNYEVRVVPSSAEKEKRRRGRGKKGGKKGKDIVNLVPIGVAGRPGRENSSELVGGSTVTSDEEEVEALRKNGGRGKIGEDSEQNNHKTRHLYNTKASADHHKNMNLEAKNEHFEGRRDTQETNINDISINMDASRQERSSDKRRPRSAIKIPESTKDHVPVLTDDLSSNANTTDLLVTTETMESNIKLGIDQHPEMTHTETFEGLTSALNTIQEAEKRHHKYFSTLPVEDDQVLVIEVNQKGLRLDMDYLAEQDASQRQKLMESSDQRVVLDFTDMGSKPPQKPQEKAKKAKISTPEGSALGKTNSQSEIVYTSREDTERCQRALIAAQTRTRIQNLKNELTKSKKKLQSSIGDLALYERPRKTNGSSLIDGGALRKDSVETAGNMGKGAGSGATGQLQGMVGRRCLEKRMKKSKSDIMINNPGNRFFSHLGGVGSGFGLEGADCGRSRSPIEMNSRKLAPSITNTLSSSKDHERSFVVSNLDIRKPESTDRPGEDTQSSHTLQNSTRMPKIDKIENQAEEPKNKKTGILGAPPHFYDTEYSVETIPEELRDHLSGQEGSEEGELQNPIKIENNDIQIVEPSGPLTSEELEISQESRAPPVLSDQAESSQKKNKLSEKIEVLYSEFEQKGRKLSLTQEILKHQNAPKSDFDENLVKNSEIDSVQNSRRVTSEAPVICLNGQIYDNNGQEMPEGLKLSQKSPVLEYYSQNHFCEKSARFKHSRAEDGYKTAGGDQDVHKSTPDYLEFDLSNKKSQNFKTEKKAKNQFQDNNGASKSQINGAYATCNTPLNHPKPQKVKNSKNRSPSPLHNRSSFLTNQVRRHLTMSTKNLPEASSDAKNDPKLGNQFNKSVTILSNKKRKNSQPSQPGQPQSANVDALNQIIPKNELNSQKNFLERNNFLEANSTENQAPPLSQRQFKTRTVLGDLSVPLNPSKEGRNFSCGVNRVTVQNSQNVQINPKLAAVLNRNVGFGAKKYFQHHKSHTLSTQNLQNGYLAQTQIQDNFVSKDPYLGLYASKSNLRHPSMPNVNDLELQKYQIYQEGQKHLGQNMGNLGLRNEFKSASGLPKEPMIPLLNTSHLTKGSKKTNFEPSTNSTDNLHRANPALQDTQEGASFHNSKHTTLQNSRETLKMTKISKNRKTEKSQNSTLNYGLDTTSHVERLEKGSNGAQSQPRSPFIAKIEVESMGTFDMERGFQSVPQGQGGVYPIDRRFEEKPSPINNISIIEYESRNEVAQGLDRGSRSGWRELERRLKGPRSGLMPGNSRKMGSEGSKMFKENIGQNAGRGQNMADVEKPGRKGGKRRHQNILQTRVKGGNLTEPQQIKNRARAPQDEAKALNSTNREHSHLNGGRNDSEDDQMRQKIQNYDQKSENIFYSKNEKMAQNPQNQEFLNYNSLNHQQQAQAHQTSNQLLKTPQTGHLKNARTTSKKGQKAAQQSLTTTSALNFSSNNRVGGQFLHSHAKISNLDKVRRRDLSTGRGFKTRPDHSRGVTRHVERPSNQKLLAYGSKDLADEHRSRSVNQLAYRSKRTGGSPFGGRGGNQMQNLGEKSLNSTFHYLPPEGGFGVMKRAPGTPNHLFAQEYASPAGVRAANGYKNDSFNLANISEVELKKRLREVSDKIRENFGAAGASQNRINLAQDHYLRRISKKKDSSKNVSLGGSGHSPMNRGRRRPFSVLFDSSSRLISTMKANDIAINSLRRLG